MTDASLDLLVLGSGVAGLSAAVRAADAHGLRVGVLTKGELAQTTTRWAQGGVAAVLDEDPDSTDLHLADTLAAGAGLCDADAVRVLVDEGPGRVHGLIALGAMFDRDEHGGPRAGPRGRPLASPGSSTPAAPPPAPRSSGPWSTRCGPPPPRCTSRSFALDLIVEGGRCRGVVVRDRRRRRRSELRAAHVLLATGGAGQLFAVTTNPVEATGDGIAMALRAGVAVADVEFVQFHPTALHHPQMPRPLLSEALRGHGALLRDADGERFVDELLPRDEVSRADDPARCSTWASTTAGSTPPASSSSTSASRRSPPRCASVGLDPATDWLPIAPAAHYLCGGVVTDLDGATSLPGLWAAGEVACSGVHGANRLASNSLLEGMVFGFRVVEAIDRGVDGPVATGAMRAVARALAAAAGPGQRPAAIGGREVTGWSPYAWRSPATASPVARSIPPRCATGCSGR